MRLPLFLIYFASFVYVELIVIITADVIAHPRKERTKDEAEILLTKFDGDYGHMPDCSFSLMMDSLLNHSIPKFNSIILGGLFPFDSILVNVAWILCVQCLSAVILFSLSALVMVWTRKSHLTTDEEYERFIRRIEANAWMI